jgi:gamma-glutamyltranspeptidase / glutathione hydrolase
MPDNVKTLTRWCPAAGLIVLVSCQTTIATTPSSGSGAGLATWSGAPAIPERVAAAYPPSWRFQPGRQTSFAPNAMVVSNSLPATQAGVEILERGGNAVDAAVAVGFALAVTYPVAGNLGGGGFMTIRMADGRTATIDYREVAPLAATRDMYVENGVLTNKSVVGYLASGVPGAVAGMAEALAKYGTMSLPEVIAPAIRLASSGFEIDSAFYRGLLSSRDLISQFEGNAVFYPRGQPLAPGTNFRQPQLARTLRMISAQGPRAFYDGEVAESLVVGMRRGGGIITREDLRRYTPKWREVVTTTYRGYTIYSMPPASSGGITMAQTLNILETYPSLPAYGSTGYTHLVAEAFRRSFMDRNSKLADADFVPVPREQLLSKSYARTLAAGIDLNRASVTPKFQGSREGENTTHYSVVDARGNAVATTTTINNSYGSGVYLTGVGIFMNDEMDDFAAQPGTPNMFGLVQGEANAIAPGKRMLSAMTPTIVTDPQGGLLLVVGAAGGPTIITSVTEVIINVIDHRMTLADAMMAPRIHHQALPDAIIHERNGLFPAVADSLRAMGHALTERSAIANVNAIMRVKGGLEGMHEPRSSGAALGY